MVLPSCCADCRYLYRKSGGIVPSYAPCLHPGRPSDSIIVGTRTKPDECCPLRQDPGPEEEHRRRVEEIYREQRAFMFGVAYSRLRDRDDAEDAVQVASMTLMRQRSLPEDARAAAYTAVDYASRDLLRRRARENDRYSRLDIDAHDHPVPSAERAAMARIEVEETARTCPEAVLIGMGYRVNEVAQRMGITVRTVYNRLAREQCRC